MLARKLWKGWVLLLGVLLAILVGRWLWPWGRQIDPADVVRVAVEPKGTRHEHPLDAEEARRVTGWFNQATGIVDNSHHGAPGCGAFSELHFYLKSGEVVAVTSYMRVTRGKPLGDLADDFYFKQPDLQQYLHDWDLKGESGGC